MYETEQTDYRSGVILVGLDTGEYDAEQSIDELSALAETAGCEVLRTVIQPRQAPVSATCIGSGKLEEVAELVQQTEADMLIFDLELTGMQIRNISEITDCKVIDRTMLILDIFAGRARTAEGKVQVMLAQYRYRLSRLVGAGSALSRLGGGIGTRGPGETKLETDRRHIRTRITTLERELRELEQHRKFIGKRRKKDGVMIVSIVGYTNAGKSALFNRLTEAGVLTENKLFATLDVTTRALSLPDGRTVLLSDTVGFIRRLPHHLVQSFRSTLEETAESDLILHVLDASEPDIRERMDITQSLLRDLNCADIPQIHVLNKADLVDFPLRDEEDAVWISAKTGYGTENLMRMIARMLPQTAKRMILSIPYTDGRMLQSIREDGRIFSEEYTESGVRIDAMIDHRRFKLVEPYVLDD